MAKSDERLKALKLRRGGLSIRSIAERLGVSKSTVSIWCRDIELTKAQRERLRSNAIVAGHKGRMMGAEMNRKKKEKLITFYNKEGERQIGHLSKRDLLIAGLALYWAEGSKTINRIDFTNSDPIMIQFMFKWFRDIMGIEPKEFMPRIFINEIHKPRINKVLRFWSSLLKLPIEQFGKPTFLKRKQQKIYENYNNYYGILTIRIRNSSKLKYRITGLIDALKKD